MLAFTNAASDPGLQVLGKGLQSMLTTDLAKVTSLALIERARLAAVMAAGGGEALEPPAQLSLAGRRLLLLHGFGGPEETVEIVDALASGGRWDAVLYGHTHEARVDYIKGRLILNPGDGGGVLNKPTAALLDLESLRARLVSLEG